MPVGPGWHRRHVKAPPLLVGWREWVRLPQADGLAVKAKIDSGARSSSLHAAELDVFDRAGVPWVRFLIHPLQRRTVPEVRVEFPLMGHRLVRSSGGHQTLRPVVVMEVEVLGRRWPIEITLVNRDTMGFRMLLGRQALGGRVTVDPARSYLGGPRDRGN